MSSRIQICNLALSLMGTRSSIANVSEDSAEADAMALHYDTSLDSVLAAAHWNFARKQANLAVLKDGTTTPPQDVPVPWLYEYGYPSECVNMRYVMPFYNNVASFTGATVPLNPPPMTPPVRFIVSTDEDDTGQDIKVVLTNQPGAIAVYTKRITNADLYDATFEYALAAYLGARACMALTGDKERQAGLFKLAQATCIDAQADNGNEGLTISDATPSWMSARSGGDVCNYPEAGILFYSPIGLPSVS